jgi:hypothetical protein
MQLLMSVDELYKAFSEENEDELFLLMKIGF